MFAKLLIGNEIFEGRRREIKGEVASYIFFSFFYYFNFNIYIYIYIYIKPKGRYTAHVICMPDMLSFTILFDVMLCIVMFMSHYAMISYDKAMLFCDHAMLCKVVT